MPVLSAGELPGRQIKFIRIGPVPDHQSAECMILIFPHTLANYTSFSFVVPGIT